MAETLYRKYRPQTFADLREQIHVKTALMNEVARDAVAHSYVFSGPRGVGKTSTARIFAKALNCTARQGSEPCNACETCREITEGRSLDVVEIDAASHTGVDNVRERIIEAVRFAPVRGKYKIFIIDEAHMLSMSAWNALLKTLEEPPAHAVFILASTELHKFPETILSRCQRFEFKKIAATELMSKLKAISDQEKVKVSDDVLRAIVRRAEGGLRDAESLLGQLLALGDKEITTESASIFMPATSAKVLTEAFHLIASKATGDFFRMLARLSEEGVDLLNFSTELVTSARLVLVAKVTQDWKAVADQFDTATADDWKRNFSALSDHEIVSLLERLVRAVDEMKRADHPTLPLEMMMVEWASHEIKPESKAVDQNQPQNSPPSTVVKIASEPSKQAPTESPKVAPLAASAPVSAPAGSFSASLEQLRSKWDAVVLKVSETSQSLPFILKLAVIHALRGPEVQLGFQYGFHADTFNKDTNRRIVEDSFQAVIGERPRCVGIVLDRPKGDVEPLSSSAPVLDQKMKSVLDEFGGKVVN